MKHDEIVGFVGTSFGAVMTALQTNEVFQIIELILSIIALVITIAYTIWKWYRKASQDGKITADEVDELFDELHNIKEEKIDDKSKWQNSKK